MTEISEAEWHDFLSHHRDAHILQTGAWGDLKSAFGWDVVRVIVDGNQGSQSSIVGAQILFKRLPLGLTIAYLPRGPVGGYSEDSWLAWESLWPEVDKLCQKRKSIFLKVEPDLSETPESGNGESRHLPENIPGGFQFSQQDIQPIRTLVVNLEADEDQVLMRMKQKTRYNIRLALKKGIVVRSSSDIDLFYRLMTETGSRDNFGVHSQEYYRRAYALFYPQGECELLVAEYKEEPLAALMVFAKGVRAWYFYGASADKQRKLMPTYLLQWEAMRWARAQDCISYDLWGVPDEDERILEDNFAKRKGGLWGVYRFKRGFGGQIERASGPYDRVYQPVLYAFYRWWTTRKNTDSLS